MDGGHSHSQLECENLLWEPEHVYIQGTEYSETQKGQTDIVKFPQLRQKDPFNAH